MLNTIHSLILSLAIIGASLLVSAPEPPQPVSPLPTPQKDTVVPIPRIPGVFVTDANGLPSPMTIQNLDVDVEITGSMARTTIDMTVFNPHDRVLEGTFSLPLNAGQTVARFALDINGKLREAVVVPKEKARETFEEVIRQKIDPALLEWTRDNAFRTRIYPLPANGTRRVVIAFEQKLTSTQSGLAYTIPFAYPEAIDTFSFHANVAGFGLKPSLAGSDDTVFFSPRGRKYEVDINKTKAMVDRPFSISVPVSMFNHLVNVNSFAGEQYFSVFLTLPTESVQRYVPKRIALLWDASLSGVRRDTAAEFRALDAFFKRVKNVEVLVETFSNEVRDRLTHNVVNGDWSEIRHLLANTPFDGGTQLGAIPFQQLGAEYNILVSDGISTFGQHEPVLGWQPVIVLNSGVPSDHDVLSAIAQKTGGQVINVSALEPTAVASRIMGTQRQITSIEAVDGAVANILPAGRVHVEHVTTISGKLLTRGATIRVTSSIDGREERVDEIEIDQIQHSSEGVSTARLWAGQELQRLGADRKRNEVAITALGMKFNIVTPNTSMLVLDRLRDYVRFNIEPPASEPDMVKQWTQQRERIESDSAEKVVRHTKLVSKLIERRRAYLMKSFDADSMLSAMKETAKKKEIGCVQSDGRHRKE